MLGNLNPSLKLLLAGALFFALFLLLLAVFGVEDRATFPNVAIVFLGLIVPPVCFAAGIILAFLRKPWLPGAVWANGAAVFAHTLAAVAVLQGYLG